MGTGIGHYIPLIAYLGFWVMALVSLTGRPLYGLYYMLPFLPYRTLRDHLLDYPLGGSVLTILVAAVIVGALIKGKSLDLARSRIIEHLRQPQFEEKFLASSGDPSSGEKNLREFHRLLREVGFA